VRRLLRGQWPHEDEAASAFDEILLSPTPKVNCGFSLFPTVGDMMIK
jgi:hypothetical protein